MVSMLVLKYKAKDSRSGVPDPEFAVPVAEVPPALVFVWTSTEVYVIVWVATDYIH